MQTADASVEECPLCASRFTRQELIQLGTLAPKGMLLVPGDATEPSQATYYFSHTPRECRTTFATPVEVFHPEITEPIPEALLFGTRACEGHCGKLSDLAACQQECSNAPYRRFLIGRLVPRK
jgi:hypothetical protein